LGSACGAWGTTLRIVSYNIDCADQNSDSNITGRTHSLPTVIEAIGLHHISTNAQQVDVLGLEELNSTTLSNFVAQLNSIYGAGTYTFEPTTDPNLGGGPDGLIYNPSTVQVVSARALPTGQTVLLESGGTYTNAHSAGGGTNGVARGPMVYQLRPLGYGARHDFYMYVSHARDGSDDYQGDARYAEAQEVRSDAKYNLPVGAHIMYSGDWNLYTGSYENAYRCLTGQTTSDGINWSDTSAVWANTNPTQGYDPTSKTTPPTTTTWGNGFRDNAPYLYSWATYSLSSRIDIQLLNGPMFGVYNRQGGVQLAPDTSDRFDSTNFPSAKYPYAFEVFGNNGTTPLGSSSLAFLNHSLDELTNAVPNARTVYGDLEESGGGNGFTGSDHYPIVGDYNVVPAPPVPSIKVAPLANFPGQTDLTVISVNGTDARVFFDGSKSYDPDGATFVYSWFEGTNLFSENVVASRVLAVGTHEIKLLLDDTLPGGTNSASVTVEVITPCGGVGIVAGLVNNSTLPANRQHPLLASLSAACTSFEQGNVNVGINQLQAFQNKVRAQVASLDPTLADQLIQAAQQILDAFGAARGGRPGTRLQPVARRSNGKMHIEFSGTSGNVWLVQASTNLQEWQTIGIAVDPGDGSFQYEDSAASTVPNRFYRIVSP
jgi:hypothetical protein